ncbi:MAG TPA: hypothetical protein VM101_10990 [Flavitalea sp.]|nr:hypothetical protein [Flavitalea sp.]
MIDRKLKIMVIASMFLLGCTAGNRLHQNTARLQSKNLDIIIANNKSYGKSHQAGYNGLSELYIKNQNTRNIFMSAYGGLNFEHIFSGDSSTYGWHIFEPRVSPMKLVRLSDTKVELQQARTKNWPLQTSMTYELSGSSIDFVFTGIPLEDVWKKHGYIGIFIASYIDSPVEKGINFIGQESSGNVPKWIYHLPLKHGVQASQRPAESLWKPGFDPGFPVTLASGLSDFKYTYPFYYGVSGENVLIMMFDNPDKDAEIRFAESPDGAGPNNPAWDFMYFKKNYKVGEKFSFHAHVVYKKFEGRDDVIKTYESWSGKKVIVP